MNTVCRRSDIDIVYDEPPEREAAEIIEVANGREQADITERYDRQLSIRYMNIRE